MCSRLAYWTVNMQYIKSQGLCVEKAALIRVTENLFRNSKTSHDRWKNGAYGRANQQNQYASSVLFVQPDIQPRLINLHTNNTTLLAHFACRAWTKVPQILPLTSPKNSSQVTSVVMITGLNTQQSQFGQVKETKLIGQVTYVIFIHSSTSTLTFGQNTRLLGQSLLFVTSINQPSSSILLGALSQYTPCPDHLTLPPQFARSSLGVGCSESCWDIGEVLSPSKWRFFRGTLPTEDYENPVV